MRPRLSFASFASQPIWLLLLLLAGLCLLAATTGKNTLMEEDVGVYNALRASPQTFTSATITQALSTIGSNPRVLLLTKGAWTFSADHTMPANVTLKVPRGTTVTIANGKVLTLAACPQIDAPGWLQAGTTGKIVITATGCTIEAHKFATSGAGSTGSHWAGWYEVLSPLLEATTYLFPKGHYDVPAMLIAVNNISLHGDAAGGTILYYTGGAVDDFVLFDGTGLPNGLRATVSKLRFDAQGNGGQVNFKFAVGGNYSDLSVTNATLAGFRMSGVILNTFTNLSVSSNLGTFTTVPPKGFILSAFAPESASTASSTNTFVNLRAEGITNGTGIYCDYAYSNQILGGTSESNGSGIYNTVNCSANTYQGMFFELNSTPHLTITGVNTGTKTFTVAGDHTADYPLNIRFWVAGSSGALNDGKYTVVSATFGGGNTSIVVAETIPSSSASGYLTQLLSTFDRGFNNHYVNNSSYNHDAYFGAPSYDNTIRAGIWGDIIFAAGSVNNSIDKAFMGAGYTFWPFATCYNAHGSRSGSLGPLANVSTCNDATFANLNTGDISIRDATGNAILKLDRTSNASNLARTEWKTGGVIKYDAGLIADSTELFYFRYLPDGSTIFTVEPGGVQHEITFYSPVTQHGFHLSNLGTPPAGSQMFCDDCNPATDPCTSGGSGAMAYRANSRWYCP